MAPSSNRLRISEAVGYAARLGLIAFEQRGFYSHFLRIRTPNDFRTLATPDIRHGTVSRRSIVKAYLKAQEKEHG